jgi:hypothetical protein
MNVQIVRPCVLWRKKEMSQPNQQDELELRELEEDPEKKRTIRMLGEDFTPKFVEVPKTRRRRVIPSKKQQG